MKIIIFALHYFLSLISAELAPLHKFYDNYINNNKNKNHNKTFEFSEKIFKRDLKIITALNPSLF